MNNRIIVLSGKQFCGKDTLAKILLKNLTSFKRIGLGDAIKIEYGEKNGLTFEEIEASKSIYRPDLIELANKRRTQDADYWIKKVISMDGDLIVPDMRVIREYNHFKNAGAFLIRVNASEESRAKRGTLAAKDDSTETELDNITDWTYVIDNESTYEELVKNSADLIEKIKEYFSL